MYITLVLIFFTLLLARVREYAYYVPENVHAAVRVMDTMTLVLA
jgi:hypothetical protein